MVRPLTSEELKDKFSNLKRLIVDENNTLTMYWINQIGDKFVTVEVQPDSKEYEKDENKGTLIIHNYVFRLYNAEFIQIGCFKYLNDILDQGTFTNGNFTFSSDGHYFGMIFNTHYLGIAYFPNGFEYDLFVEQSLGQAALEKMFKGSNQYLHFNKQLVLDEACT